MKRFLKITSAVLSAMMLSASPFSVSANAATVKSNFSQAVKASARADEETAYKNVEKYLSDGNQFEYSIGRPFDTDFGEYMVFPAYYTNVEYPIMLISRRLRGYIFESDKGYVPSNFACLAVNIQTGEVFTIENAILDGLVDADKFYKYYNDNKDGLRKMFRMNLIGDFDYDGRLSVKDATELQKSLVYEYDLNAPDLKGDDITDVNFDGNTNVLDVTEIQKIIVR